MRVNDASVRRTPVTLFRIPPLPQFTRTKFPGGIDLVPDLFVFKVPFIKGIISKCLKPWPEAGCYQLCTLLGSFEGTIDDFVGICNSNQSFDETRDYLVVGGLIRMGR